MAKIRRLAQTLVLWGVVGAGVGVILAAWAWGPAIVRHASAMAAGPRSGAGRRPTPAEMEAARLNWMRRKFGREQDGPSVQQVIEYHNRNHIGPESPDDVLEPEQ